MPVILDTDHLSILQGEEQPACDRLLARLDRLPADDIATTIVSFHEQVQGWLAYLNRAKMPEQIVRAYGKLEAMWRSFLRINVISFDDSAQTRFDELRPRCRKVKAMDLRIASITIETGAVLLSINLHDFRQV